MAKQTSNVKKIELNFLTFLKELTNFLNRDNYNKDILLKLIEKHEVNSQFLFKRLIAYTYNNPYIIWYINKYMNNKYDYYKYDVEEFLISFKYLLKTNNHGKLFFFKAKDFKDENKYKIKLLLKEYFEVVFRKQLNDLELNHLYMLFYKKIIPIDEIYRINTLLNGDKSKLVLDENFLFGDNSISNNSVNNDQEKINEYINFHISKMLPDNIYQFVNQLQIKKQQDCQKCKIFNNTMVSLDTNVSDFQPVDFMFILLNPGKDESIYKKLCIGESGKLLRQSMYYLDSKISWVITNAIQCTTNNQAELGKTDKAIKLVINGCKPFLNSIIEKFPAKYYITVGKHSMELFGVKGSITQHSGTVLVENNKSIIPLIHPSAIKRNEAMNIPVYNKTWDLIYQIAKKLVGQTVGQIDVKNIPVTSSSKSTNSQSVLPVQQSNKYNIDPTKIITGDIPAGMTYFDSVNLDGNDILNTFINSENSEKYYQIIKYEVPIYIKHVNDYKDCNMLNQNFEYVTHINGWNKYKLSKALKDNLIKHKFMALSNS